jgi:hypothetical protein
VTQDPFDRDRDLKREINEDESDRERKRDLAGRRQKATEHRHEDGRSSDTPYRPARDAYKELLHDAL